MRTTSSNRRTRLARALAHALCAAGIAIHAPTVAARAADAPPADETPEKRADPLGRETPRDAVYGYIVAGRDGDFERAAEYLDLSRVPEADRATVGPRVAHQLKVVLDRKLWIDWERVDDTPAGRADDGLPARRERLGTLQTDRGAVDVLLARVPGADGEPIWKFASATVGNVPALYEEFGYGLIGELLPGFMFEVQFLDAELWQWFGLLLAIGGAYLASVLAAAVAFRLARPLVTRTRSDLDDVLLRGMIGPLRLVFGVSFFFLLTLPLTLSVGAQKTLAGVEQALVVVAVAWFVVRMIDVFGERAERVLLEQGRRTARGLIPIGRRLVKIVVWLLAVLAVLQNVGFEVTGLIAGLGIGGLAVALAAQKTLENVFGALTLAADEPVAIGDFCRFGDQIGTVEEIGLRSTKVRTLARTLVSVPNSEFASLHLENFAKRDQMWLKAMIGVRYETTPDQLRFLLVGLRRMLIGHPRIAPEPVRARFVEFGAYSLDIEVFCYVETEDWNEFVAIREDVFLRIMDIVEQSGTGFAFPSQTIYRGDDTGLDDEASRAAEAQVQAWREQSALPFPDFPEAEQARLDDTLAYPPEGSATRSGA
ncbi:MAG: mechanosensitive ion channel family protein [Deltaproteobacteria bacterium]|nr:MAG: mechanosensitive ion channel family protein [Deltaproteobacteria bacterium]